MRPCGSKPEFLCGLCKIHKNLMNLMDCLYFAQSFSKIFRTDTFNGFTVNDYKAKDSFTISNEIRNRDTNLLGLTSSLYSQIYHWMRQLEFAWNCCFIK